MHSVIDSVVTDWSSDGRYVVYMANELGTNWNIWAMSLMGDQRPQPVLRTQFNETDARISPDGRWLAYVTNESGGNEVYVSQFPPGSDRVRISTEGGGQLRWRADGQELFYIDPSGRLMAVDVREHDGELEASPPSVLFQTQVASVLKAYSVSADGQRFLINSEAAPNQPPPVVVVPDWVVAVRQAARTR